MKQIASVISLGRISRPNCRPLALEVEELAGVLLTHLNSYSDVSGSPVLQHGRINRHHFFNRLEHTPDYPGYQEKVNRALMEAWSWLQGEGFLVRDPGPGPDWFFISTGTALEIPCGV